MCWRQLYGDNALKVLLTYQNSTYGLIIKYPGDWTVKEGNRSIVVTFHGPDPSSTNQTYIVVNVRVGHEITPLTLVEYAYTTVSDYQSFPAFKLLSLDTNLNSTLAGHHAYKLIGTYEDVSDGPQKVMDVGTIIDHEAYYIQSIADVIRYSEYLPILEEMIDSLKINSQTRYILPYKWWKTRIFFDISWLISNAGKTGQNKYGML
jgi:hypothetical protein